MKLFCFIFLQITSINSQLNELITNFLEKPSAQNINVSMSIRDIESKNEVYAYQSKMALPPASTLKLLTTGTSIDILGPNFEFKTLIVTNGNIQNGILNGDLLIIPEGDPSFGSQRFNLNPTEQIVTFLKDKGIRTINGKITIIGKDERIVPNEWLVSDIGNYYGAFPRQFNFGENFYTVYFKGGDQIGDASEINKIVPLSSNWKIRNNVRTGESGSGDQVNIINMAPSDEISLEGTVPLKSNNFGVKGSIPEPKSVFLDILKNELSGNSINVLENVISEPLGNDTIGIIFSPSLEEISQHCNYQSVNFFADGMANYIFTKLKEPKESFGDFMKRYWKAKGLNLDNFNLYDGSGLSTMNTISTQTMTDFLSIMVKSKYFESFSETIAVVGKSGTVRSLDPKGLTRGKVAAKSGSISGTRNYAGYFKGQDDKKYAFCVFVNGINDTAKLFSRELLQNLIFKMIDLNQL
ncbi:D-alanyl-D-alanine carboxypeptidase/D-alanyl-D-alanine-endopeptidase [Lacihabitans sp. LS3-19]|uniref:D-alanyl-D-alanine carboxypeptidase/D-alanyl-D-alanine endopeptidase n=1 Tax=Lacihabitans sp. LS3-19 TaxID=2487335 RepID=UPI0020CE5D7F|nr:D-alanyl-D-alanine carboxypeptidase/D-alanyl-D-alanine-endopeptidase [Lacihabitans sp. LS3-19]MCP9769849.1 D-alanyl-D-alanine carboxypeptidase/D-alanyl-D-alanine-endopeptidase [Lacihabitans sp. LS3-19]